MLLASAVALSAAMSAEVFLPLLPVQHLAATPITDINDDAGETIGWPALVRTVARVHAGLPVGERTGAVVLTRNDGQAGAIDRYRTQLGLPAVHSGHNSYASWGPPPEAAGPTIVVGYDRDWLLQRCTSVELGSRIDNGVGLENDEQGTAVWICRDRLAPWAQLWPGLRRFG